MTAREELAQLLQQASGVLAELQGSYPTIRAVYRSNIAQAMTEYLASDKPSTSYKARFSRAMSDAFLDGFKRGYEETAGSLEDVDPEAYAWLASRQDAELGYIAELFVSLKAARDEFWRGEMDANDLRLLVQQRVDGYAASLDAVYNAGRMWGAKNRLIIWHLGHTKEHCKTCARLNNARHRAKWFIARNYIPRRPGAAMECGGYQCGCYFTDAVTGEMFTL